MQCGDKYLKKQLHHLQYNTNQTNNVLSILKLSWDSDKANQIAVVIRTGGMILAN